MARMVVYRQHTDISLRRIAAKLNSRVSKLILALLFGLIGYLCAPANLLPGEYTATISLREGDKHYAIDHQFTLGGEEGQVVIRRARAGQYTLEVEGVDAIPYRLDQQISFRVRLLKADAQSVNTPIHAISAVIHAQDYEQQLPPTGSDADWHLFAMRVPYKAKYITALLFAVAILWITELLPLAATAMLIPVVATLTGVADATSVLEPFASPIIALFMVGFLLADTMRRTGVDRRIALLILNRTSRNPIYLMLTLMAITAFLCLWMSNTATASLMIPIALAIVSRLPTETMPKGYARALVLAIAYSATIGGVGSAIGTPPHMLAISFLNQYGFGNITFLTWFAFGLPFVLLMLPVVWIYLLLSFRVNTWQMRTRLDSTIYAEELTKLGPLGNKEKWLAAVFLIIVALWLTESWHHISPAIAALAGVCVLFFFQLIEKEAINNINWNALLTFGGGLAIGTLLVSTGVSDWLALKLIGLTTVPTYIVLLLIIGATVLIGAFISNTACAAMLIPVAIPLAQILNLDPRLLVTLIAIASSVDFALITGTPPTMIAYSTGMFSAGDIFRRGAIVDIFGIMILSFGAIWIWQWLGVVTL